MNCPLCDGLLDERGICPNCSPEAAEGSPFPRVTECSPLPEASQIPFCNEDGEIPPISTEDEDDDPPVLPGIYYDKLEEIWDEAQAAEEESCRPRKEPRFTRGEAWAIRLCVLFLLLFIGLIAVNSTTYDPTTVAISGRDGISIDNRNFAIYCHSVIKQVESQSETPLYDASRPLNRQYYNLDAGYTWEDYFMAQAFSTAALTEILLRNAEAEGFALPEEEEATLAQALTALEQQGKAAYGDMDRYTAQTFGKGVTWETYCQYRRDSALAQAYTNHRLASYQYTDQELSDYYDDNYSTYGDIPKNVPNADIRHILFAPEAATAEADAAALLNALDAYAQCTSGGEDQVESIFLRLVPEYSQDTGSNANGGLLEDVAPGTISTAISSWLFSSGDRLPGDLTVLPSSYGYHVVYFVGYRDNYEWKDTVLQDMQAESLRKEFTRLMDEADCHLTRFAAIDWPLSSEVTP